MTHESKQMLRSGALHLPLPAAGDSATRWLALADLAGSGDVSVARLCEAHVDAVAILAEAGRRPHTGALYGVWASNAPGGTGVRFADGVLAGSKPFCSGLGIVDRALIEVDTPDGRRLLDVGLGPGTDGVDLAGTSQPRTLRTRIEWATTALAGTKTGTIAFDEHPVDDHDVIGGTGWYLARPGFWHGAVGPAACWAGAVIGLIDVVDAGDDPHRQAAVGGMAADAWAMRTILRRAGDEMDDDPHDCDAARRRARTVRHLIHELATDVIDRFLRAFGPRPLVGTPGVADRLADAQLYLRQYHGDRDLAALGRDIGATDLGEP